MKKKKRSCARRKAKGKAGKLAVRPKYRRNGNVARLAKVVRDKINVMIQDGVSYTGIIAVLGKKGKGLDISNLSRWKSGGYQDWLAEQAFIARVRARQETPSDLTRNFDSTEVGQAALQLGTLHIFEAMRELGPGSMDEKLGGNSLAFARLLNALARASRETMLLQKYREACLRARATLQELGDPNRKISEKTTRAIVRQVDGILGLRSMDEGQGKAEIRRPKVERSPKAERRKPNGETDGEQGATSPLILSPRGGEGEHEVKAATSALVVPTGGDGADQYKDAPLELWQ